MNTACKTNKKHKTCSFKKDWRKIHQNSNSNLLSLLELWSDVSIWCVFFIFHTDHFIVTGGEIFLRSSGTKCYLWPLKNAPQGLRLY